MRQKKREKCTREREKRGRYRGAATLRKVQRQCHRMLLHHDGAVEPSRRPLYPVLTAQGYCCRQRNAHSNGPAEHSGDSRTSSGALDDTLGVRSVLFGEADNVVR